MSHLISSKSLLLNRCLLLLSAIGFLVVNIPTVYSCECFDRPHRKDFRQSKTIFIGTVLTISSNTSEDEQSHRPPPYAVKLAVEKMWKGKKVPEITVVTENRATCNGFEFHEGERYLVYAFGNDLVAFSGCTRSGPLDPAAECTIKNVKKLNSFWFRLFARLFPF